MDEAELRRRAADADGLLGNPLLKSVLDELEREAIEAMLAVGAVAMSEADDRKRRELADRVHVVRHFRTRLHAMVLEGRRAAVQPKQWA